MLRFTALAFCAKFTPADFLSIRPALPHCSPTNRLSKALTQHDQERPRHSTLPDNKRQKAAIFVPAVFIVECCLRWANLRRRLRISDNSIQMLLVVKMADFYGDLVNAHYIRRFIRGIWDRDLHVCPTLAAMSIHPRSPWQHLLPISSVLWLFCYVIRLISGHSVRCKMFYLFLFGFP